MEDPGITILEMVMWTMFRTPVIIAAGIEIRPYDMPWMLDGNAL
jgi:hypothetical protein